MRHKNIDIICVITICLAVILTVLFMNGRVLGLTATADTDLRAIYDFAASLVVVF